MTRKASSPNGITEPVAGKKLLTVEQPKPSFEKRKTGCHSIYWWSIKVACGAILIASLFIGVLYELSPWFSSPRVFAQMLVIVGGLSAIFHYLHIKSFNSKFERPDTLVTEQGLFKYVRHPMYLSDCLTYSGLFLLFPTIPTAMVLVVGVVALLKQSKIEDRYLAARFDQQFSGWRKRSKLIVPFLY
ncbi:MAG: protein-S-isoprenylcysteine O-methyltransferase Ste14 [Arenicella sp.]|jgi:protein-S-isoprenylcysteine O-methyltransferase Ste14